MRENLRDIYKVLEPHCEITITLGTRLDDGDDELETKEDGWPADILDDMAEDAMEDSIPDLLTSPEIMRHLLHVPPQPVETVIRNRYKFIRRAPWGTVYYNPARSEFASWEDLLNSSTKKAGN